LPPRAGLDARIEIFGVGNGGGSKGGNLNGRDSGESAEELALVTGGAQHAVKKRGELAGQMAKRGQQAPSIFFEWPEKRGALPPP